MEEKTTHKSYQKYLRDSFSELIDEKDLNEDQKTYLKIRWLDQLLWYDSKANFNRNWHRRIRTLSITLNVIVVSLVGLNISDSERAARFGYYILTATGLITIAQSLDEFHKFKDLWFTYRKSAESLKSLGWDFLLTDDMNFEEFTSECEAVIEKDIETFVRIGKKEKRTSDEKPGT